MRDARGVSAAAALTALLTVGLVLLALLLAGPMITIPLRVPLNYNEGWNAYFATRAVIPGAGPLYPPPGSLVFDNYPPLSFYLVGWVGRLISGDMIVVGRAVALASLLACGTLLAVALRGLAGVAAGLLLVLCACVFFRDYVAMDDPQWLGHALMLGGLAVLMRRGTGLGSVFLAALPVLAGGFVKHNLVALPIAIAVGLMLRERRAAVVYVAVLGVGIAAGLLAIGPAGVGDILHHDRLWQPGGMAKGAGRLLPFVPAALVAGLSLWPRRREPVVMLAAVFAGVAAATGIAQRAGAGVAVNAQFETLIAVCFAVGLALREGRRWPPAVVWAVAAAPILVVLPKRLDHAWADISQGQARAAAWRPVIARIAAAPGPVACETLALCYWAGKPFSVDFFNLTQHLLARGSRFDPPGFALVEYDPTSPIHPAGHDPLMDPILLRTVAVARGPGHVVLLGPN